MREGLNISYDALKNAISNLGTEAKGRYTLPKKASAKKVFSLEEKRGRYRKKLEKALQSHPNLSLGEVMGKNGSTYSWLKQHVSEWLKNKDADLKKDT